MDFRFPDVTKNLTESDDDEVLYPVGALDLWIRIVPTTAGGAEYAYLITYASDPTRHADPTVAGAIITGQAGYDSAFECFVDGVLNANERASFEGLPYQDY